MTPLILIIDDSDLILHMLTMIVEQAGYRSAACADLSAAREIIARETPAVILSDLNLPGLQGQDPVHALRQVPGSAHTPIILISGLEAAPLAQKARELGADAALSKDAGLPAMAAELPALIQSLLN